MKSRETEVRQVVMALTLIALLSACTVVKKLPTDDASSSTDAAATSPDTSLTMDDATSTASDILLEDTAAEDAAPNPDLDTGTEVAPQPDGTPNPEPDTGSNPDPDAGSNPDPDAGSNPDPDAGSNPDPDAGSNPDPDTGADVPCQPDCAGKACGTDGCGGSCGDCPSDGGCGDYIGCIEGTCAWEPGDCDDGDLCTVDVCDIEAGCITTGTTPGPCEWPGTWTIPPQNPVLMPAASTPQQGADNIYAADVLWHAGMWWMWYGGQGNDGHDAVFLATSDDLVSWQNHGGDSPIPVVDHGSSNHVNDPSVVLVGGTFYMYYTEAPTFENDEIHLATSTDGTTWTKHGVVLDVGPADSWEPDRVGRPSVLYEEGEFRMWYDGQIFGVARHVGYASSPDGTTWTRYPDNPIVMHEGAIDVDRVGQWYVMLAETGSGTNLYVAPDPVSWQFVGKIFGLSGQPYDAHGQVTPFLLTDGDEAKAIFFGGASDACWCNNRIAIAFPDNGSCAPSCEGSVCGGDGCGGSCGACPEGEICKDGACAPGSGDCTGCLGGFANCNTACQVLGLPSGTCVSPGSTDPGDCCACAEDTGCEDCLVDHATCMAACQGTGNAGGYCGAPGSQDPAACCTCF